MPEQGKGTVETGAGHRAERAVPARRPNRGPSAGPENRRALIAAAREVFAADGLNAPFNAIAKRAGVGQGSLYRHFPDRLELAIAVFDENIDELEASVASSDATLDDLLEAIIEQAVGTTALVDLIWGNRQDARVDHLGDRVGRLVDTVLPRERAAGRVGDHVHRDDVLLAITMLAALLGRTEAAERRAVAHRAWTLFHAGFAPR